MLGLPLIKILLGSKSLGHLTKLYLTIESFNALSPTAVRAHFVFLYKVIAKWQTLSPPTCRLQQIPYPWQGEVYILFFAVS